MNKSQRGRISTLQLALVIFVSRVSVSLTNVQAVSVGRFSPDILISIALSCALTLLSCLPAIMCIKRGKNPLDNRLVSLLYSLYFSFYAAVTITRFSYFASTKMNPEISFEVFLIILSVAMCYVAYLGIESIARYASFCAVILVLVIAVVVGLNAKKLEPLYFYPALVNPAHTILRNATLFTSNTIAPAVALALCGRVDDSIQKPLIKGVLLSYFAIFILVYFALGVLGFSGDLQAFPIFSLFQMASSDVLSRLDIIHTAFWILGVLMKCSLLIYCASLFTKKGSSGAKCGLFSAISFAISYALISLLGIRLQQPMKIAVFVCYAVFMLAIPIIFLAFKRGDDIEKA